MTQQLRTLTLMSSLQKFRFLGNMIFFLHKLIAENLENTDEHKNKGMNHSQ